MTAAKVLTLVGIVGFVVAMSLLSTAFLKFFARGQTYTVLLFAVAISTVLVAFYFYAKATMGLPSSTDAVAGIAMLVLSGVFIASRSRRRGVETAGRLGVGARTILGLLVLGSVAAGLYLLLTCHSCRLSP